MIYELIVRTEPERSEYLSLAYDDVLNLMIDRLLSEKQFPLTIRRRCCSSVHEQTMTVETCNKVREIAGADKLSKGGDGGPDIRMKLDIAVNNWYLRGMISLSDEDLIKPFDSCPTG